MILLYVNAAVTNTGEPASVQGFWPAWIVNPQQYQFLNSANLWMGILGFIITVAGFWVALRRLSAVKTAADAATNAVNSFKLRLTHYDAANDASEARYALTATSRHLELSSWRDVSEGLTDVRSAMLRTTKTLETKDTKLAGEVRRLLLGMAKVISLIDEGLADPSKLPTAVSTKQMIRSATDTVFKIQQALQELPDV
ncbi:hypothetical protein [Sphingomonas sp. PB4P5]|uniref:hypothetical protein n=1 Tax=Parasphingomonas puruogangriensis TaxID=3096155 RepID=UPI002FC767E5